MRHGEQNPISTLTFCDIEEAETLEIAGSPDSGNDRSLLAQRLSGTPQNLSEIVFGGETVLSRGAVESESGDVFLSEEAYVPPKGGKIQTPIMPARNCHGREDASNKGQDWG